MAVNISSNGKEETKMQNEKKVYETPEVTKVEFDASDRITASMTMQSGYNYVNTGAGTCSG